MFHAYVDGSKDALDTFVTVAAGWAADGRAWEAFNEAWETVLYRTTPEGEKLYVVFDHQAGATGRIPHLVQRLRTGPRTGPIGFLTTNRGRKIVAASQDSRRLICWRTRRSVTARPRFWVSLPSACGRDC
jgi:hypothetical protein